MIGEPACSDWNLDASKRVVKSFTEQGYADATIASVVRVMSSIARAGRERGYLEPGVEPAKGAFRFRATNIDLTDLPTAHDIEKVATAAVEVTGQAWRETQVYAAAYSGLRAGAVHTQPVL